jgi:hypothetical protein
MSRGLGGNPLPNPNRRPLASSLEGAAGRVVLCCEVRRFGFARDSPRLSPGSVHRGGHSSCTPNRLTPRVAPPGEPPTRGNRGPPNGEPDRLLVPRFGSVSKRCLQKRSRAAAVARRSVQDRRGQPILRRLPPREGRHLRSGGRPPKCRTAPAPSATPRPVVECSATAKLQIFDLPLPAAHTQGNGYGFRRF